MADGQSEEEEAWKHAGTSAGPQRVCYLTAVRQLTDVHHSHEQDTSFKPRIQILKGLTGSCFQGSFLHPNIPDSSFQPVRANSWMFVTYRHVASCVDVTPLTLGWRWRGVTTNTPGHGLV